MIWLAQTSWLSLSIGAFVVITALCCIHSEWQGAIISLFATLYFGNKLIEL